MHFQDSLIVYSAFASAVPSNLSNRKIHKFILLKEIKLLGKYNTWTKRGNGICLTILYCSEDHRHTVACLSHSIKLGKMLLWRKGRRKLWKYLLTPFFRNSPGVVVMRVPGAGENSGLWSERVMGSLLPPILSLTLVLPRKAARQSELIVTHSGKSSLALPHMATRCAERHREEGWGIQGGEKQVASLANFIICLLFPSVLCLRNEREGSWGRWNAFLFAHSLEAEWNSLSSSKYQNFLWLSMCWECFTFSFRNEKWPGLSKQSGFSHGWDWKS